MIDLIFDFVSNFQLIYLVKLLFLVIALFYFVFTLVIYQQVNLMSQVIETTASWVVKFLSLAFIFSAIVLFGLVVVLV